MKLPARVDLSSHAFHNRLLGLLGWYKGQFGLEFDSYGKLYNGEN